jgi:hypothetical protein
MLIFFIHGVATRDANYSKLLSDSIKKEFTHLGQKLPYFYSSFWGNVLTDFNKIWNHIDEDLTLLEKRNPGINVKDAFRYRQVREGLISEFAGDMFTYMNEKQGREVRQLIADQLRKFKEKHPEEEEIHIIVHSLGTVILWDVLFSDKFKDDDPAHAIRNLISKPTSETNGGRSSLSSITTMGSPILFFNAMLGINAQEVERKIQSYTSRKINWLNIVHASDIIAYPLSTSLGLNDDSQLIFRDQFICKDANLLEAAARKFGQPAVALVASVVGAHNSYWTLPEVTQFISNQIISKIKSSERIVISLKKFVGLSPVKVKLHLKKDLVDTIVFRDGSGRLEYKKNFANVYHIYVCDDRSKRLFSGCVNLVYRDALLEKIEYIKREFGDF